MSHFLQPNTTSFMIPNSPTRDAYSSHVYTASAEALSLHICWARVHDYTQERALAAQLDCLNSFTRAIVNLAGISQRAPLYLVSCMRDLRRRAGIYWLYA